MFSRSSHLQRLANLLGWTRHSFYLFSAFVLVCGLIIYIWWPLADEILAYIDWNGPWWLYFDWLLVGIWLVMSLLIMAGADLRTDAKIIFVGAVGGLVIEAWGTQTNLWHYYTAERPPLWIIPAWPIAALSTDRLVRIFDNRLSTLKNYGPSTSSSHFLLRFSYWLIFVSFYALMLVFVAPTLNKPLTWMALILCALLIATPIDHRSAVIIFLTGAGLGYFLEVWGTTRQCWTYYTMQTPPTFAILAHGMAAIAFWRTVLIVNRVFNYRAKHKPGINT